MPTQVKFVKGNLSGSGATYLPVENSGKIEFDSNNSEIWLDGVPYSLTKVTELSEQSTTEIGVGDTLNEAIAKLNKNIEDSKIVISAALNDLNDRKADSEDLSSVALSGDYEDLSNTPELADVAFSGDYEDLINTPGAVTFDSELNSTSTNGVQNKVIYKTITDNEEVTAAALNDLEEKKANINDLADVATSGNYNDLTNKPTIPAAVTESVVSGWGFTKNTGTITGITMNGTSKGTSGVVNLGTVLTAHQDISGKANLASPTFTGTPAAPTAATGTNTTQIATTAFVQLELAAFDNEIFVAVSTLPTTNINTNKIYIVPNSLADPSNNLYDEYIYKNNAWELIGTSQIDLNAKEDKLIRMSISEDSADTYSLVSGTPTYSDLNTALVNDKLAVAQISRIGSSDLTAWYSGTIGTGSARQHVFKTGTDTYYISSSGVTHHAENIQDDLVETTYANLVSMRTNNQLVPGVWYRITDYVTTTAQPHTQSAGHQFDVIVLALSNNTLSEEARAIQHSGDTYFANSNLNAWKIWYCLENDTDRFAWADDSVDESIPASITINGVKYNRNPQEDELAGIHPYAWKADTAGKVFTNEEEPSVYPSNAYNKSTGGKGTKSYTIDLYTRGHEGTNLPNGRGVIYRLIDEFNNDIKYDFKNILFQRTITDGSYDTGGTNTWCYTLNIWYNNSCQDASVVGNTLQNDGGFVIGVYNNIFGYAMAYSFHLDDVNTFAFALGDNVVLSLVEDGYYNGFASNTIGNEFYINTIGNSFFANTIGDVCHSNTIGNGFAANTIGDVCHSNTIGNSFFGNTIGNGFASNTIDGEFHSNTIGNYSIENKIGNGFVYNTIGGDFQFNTIGNSFIYNTIGNDFRHNTIGNDCGSNTIGTGTGSTAATINYVHYICVEDGVQFVNITTTATTSSSNYLQNIVISRGIKGTSSNRKTITHPTVNDTFKTTYAPQNSQTITV